jgi:hypothetical protein
MSITPPQKTKMGSQGRIRIYIGFNSSSIIRFLEPFINNVFKACSEDCHFNENIFLLLRKEKLVPEAR